MKQCTVETCDKPISSAKSVLCHSHKIRESKWGSVYHPESLARENHKVEYMTWRGFCERCSNVNSPSYKDYGGRGISVAPEWRASFAAFCNYLEATIGFRPSTKYSLDRINNNDGYKPGNLRWATRHQQAYNNRARLRLPDDHHPGVYFIKQYQKWIAMLQANRIKYRSDYFDTKEEAIEARKALEKEHNVVYL